MHTMFNKVNNKKSYPPTYFQLFASISIYKNHSYSALKLDHFMASTSILEQFTACIGLTIYLHTILDKQESNIGVVNFRTNSI